MNNVDQPAHYRGKTLVVRDVTEDFELNHNLSSAVEYILRCEKKGNKRQDLEKAIWNLQRELTHGTGCKESM